MHFVKAVQFEKCCFIYFKIKFQTNNAITTNIKILYKICKYKFVIWITHTTYLEHNVQQKILLRSNQ